MHRRGADYYRISEELFHRRGEKVQINSFGKFYVCERKEIQERKQVSPECIQEHFEKYRTHVDCPVLYELEEIGKAKSTFLLENYSWQ